MTSIIGNVLKTLFLSGLLLLSVQPAESFEIRHQFRVKSGDGFIEIIYKEFGFSYRITKTSSRSHEKKKRQKIYRIQFFHLLGTTSVPINIEPITVYLPIDAFSSEYGSASLGIDSRAAGRVSNAAMNHEHVLGQPPFRLDSMNDYRRYIINFNHYVAQNEGSDNICVSFSGESALQRTRSTENRKLPYRPGNFIALHELILINPQFIHILTSLMSSWSEGSFDSNFQSALLAAYLWGGQSGFPNMFQAFVIPGVNAHGEYQLQPVNNPDIGTVNVAILGNPHNYANHVDFNQPFPPHINNWIPGIEPPHSASVESEDNNEVQSMSGNIEESHNLINEAPNINGDIEESDDLTPGTIISFSSPSQLMSNESALLIFAFTCVLFYQNFWHLSW